MPRPRLLALVAAGALMVAGGCVPPKQGNDREVIFPPETIMGQIQAAGELVIAIPDNRPPFGPGAGGNTEGSGELEGFDVDVAREVAGTLGVEIEVRAVAHDELMALVREPLPPRVKGEPLPALDPARADLVFPLLPITEKTVKTKESSVSDPYFVGHQRILAPAGSGIEGADDLAGQTVCQQIEPDVEVDLGPPMASRPSPVTAWRCCAKARRARPRLPTRCWPDGRASSETSGRSWGAS